MPDDQVNMDHDLQAPVNQNNQARLLQDQSKLWYVLVAFALFTWVLSSKLGGTLEPDHQMIEAVLIWFLTCLTASTGVLVLIKYAKLRLDESSVTKAKIHLHLRIFYWIFVAMIVFTQIYWIAFKILFRRCDRIVDVDFTEPSGQALYYGQIAYAFASLLFAPALCLWLEVQQKFSDEQYNKAIHHIVVGTLFAKTCYVYLDEARIMVEHIVKPECLSIHPLLTGAREILFCAALQNSSNFDRYAQMYNAHEVIMEPLQYAASAEGLTTFIVVLILLKHELQDKSEHSSGQKESISWRNAINFVFQKISSHKCIAMWFISSIFVSWCLSSGVFGIFVPLFFVDEESIGTLWSSYLILRIAIFILLSVGITISLIVYFKSNHHPANDNKPTTATERLDLNLLFYAMVFGPIPQSLFSGFASIVIWSTNSDCPGTREHNILQTFESATNLIQAVLQYIFIVTAVHFKAHKKKSSSSLVETGVVLMLIVFQIFMWITNIGSKHIINKIDRSGHDYYPSTFWGVAMAVTYPSAVFFRAHSLILCGTIIFGYFSSFRNVERDAGLEAT